MATTGADFLQGLNMILSQQQERERFKVTQALAMMQFAQQKRLANVAIAEKGVAMAESTNKQLKHDIASQFLSRSGLSGAYVDVKEVDADKSPITAMIKKLQKGAGYGGGKFSDSEARGIARAMTSFYVSKDPTGVISLAKRYGDADAARIGGYGSPKQKALFKSLGMISGEADLTDLSEAARESLQIGKNIVREKTEFVEGGEDAYTFERAMGQSEDLVVALDYLREATGDLNVRIKVEKQVLDEIDTRITELQSKASRTDEESEELYELPGVKKEKEKEVNKIQTEINRRTQISLDKVNEELEKKAGSATRYSYNPAQRI